MHADRRDQTPYADANGAARHGRPLGEVTATTASRLLDIVYVVHKREIELALPATDE